MNLKNGIILFILVLLITSCDQKNFYFEQVNRINNSWGDNDFKTFKFPVKQKDSKFTLYFVLRNNNDYKYSNIYFFTQFTSPQGEMITDTLEYQLAYPDGRWTGFGMGEVKQNTLVYKENIQLADTGIYKVSVGQAMREKKLIGLEDISLMVEKN
ncbi:gliding motility lipoprotein GldH [Flavobacteriaceae bacterium Ap0902]|nr:gliding motility lipoprotein GldH [Flavobacteriaceae bacterium Ap0902]